jgi:beta-1,2-mannobiose phosphorylase / 1,2-beta-oligomannan phosphorylase
MERFSDNPILAPIEKHNWESRGVFNPAAIFLDGKVRLLYRALGNDNISRIGYATSLDGYTIKERLDEPVFQPASESEINGCEDPRITVVDGQLLMAYTALQEFRHLQVYQIALTTIAKEDFLSGNWNWTTRRLPFPGIRNKDAVIFPEKIGGKYVMLHRIDPDICIASSEDLVHWCDISSVMRPQIDGWDNWKIGVAGQPIKIDEGWLMVYHGVSVDRVYSLGVALLDTDHPEQVLYRSKKTLLSPKEDYERFGKVPNVVFSCGNIIRDNKLFIYYGAADNVVCVATMKMDELLSFIHR